MWEDGESSERGGRATVNRELARVRASRGDSVSRRRAAADRHRLSEPAELRRCIQNLPPRGRLEDPGSLGGDAVPAVRSPEASNADGQQRRGEEQEARVVDRVRVGDGDGDVVGGVRERVPERERRRRWERAKASQPFCLINQ